MRLSCAPLVIGLLLTTSSVTAQERPLDPLFASFSTDGGADDLPPTLVSLAQPNPPPPVPPPLNPPPPSAARLPGNMFPVPEQPRNTAFLDQIRGSRRSTLNRPMLSTPNLFGDSTDGGCGQAEFLAGTVPASLEHPTFNCVRANLAENNSPLPRDRVYFRYNHFHNITDISIFPDTFDDGVSSLHIDRFTFGGEMTFFDERVSLEARLPFARQLTSDVLLYDVQGAYNLPLDDYRTELLNAQLILKALLVERQTFALSGGAGLNMPSAQDFNIRLFVDDDNFEIIAPGIGQIASIAVDADIRGTVPNGIWNLSPFLAYLWTPRPRIFTQGFLQTDVPLNGVTGTVSGSVGTPGNQMVFGPLSEEFYQQTLMRMNLGGGYWFLQRPQARLLKGWAGVLELHYTTTLQDAKIIPLSLPLVTLPPPLPPATLNADVNIGNLANRVDILNLTTGSHFQIGERTTLGVGFVVPLRGGSDHPFDFELNVLLNHLL